MKRLWIRTTDELASLGGGFAANHGSVVGDGFAVIVVAVLILASAAGAVVRVDGGLSSSSSLSEGLTATAHSLETEQLQIAALGKVFDRVLVEWMIR